MGANTSHDGASNDGTSQINSHNDSHNDNRVDNSQKISGQNISGQTISGDGGHSFSIGNQTNTTSLSAQLNTPQQTVVPSITIANVTGGKVRLYYNTVQMDLSDLIEGSQLKKGDSILILEGTFKKTPLPQSLYVTGFQVESGNTYSCPEESPLNGLNNLLAEYNEGHPKSYILTVDKDVKLAETGKIWVDEDGVDYNPKKTPDYCNLQAHHCTEEEHTDTVAAMGGNQSITVITVNRCSSHSAQPNTPQKTLLPSITIANVTGGKVRLYYNTVQMDLSDLIEGSQLKDSDSILILEGTIEKTPLPQNLYVTGFQVESDNTHSCLEKSPLYGLNNFLAEYAEGHPKSYILTVDKEVKFAKTGEIWVDEDGVDHTPKK
ncbi:unnamed protein product [Coregonus sp. 'balchen']|nr:unnamed protein product [Coregonus sp. 'balchen']